MRNVRAYELNIDEITRLAESRGLSLSEVAIRADVHETTLRRWLKGGLAYMKNVAVLASVLDTTPDRLIQKEELVEECEIVSPLPPRQRVKITVTKYDFEAFGEAESAELLKTIMDVIQARGDVVVVSTEKGSVVVTLEMDYIDYTNFREAVANGSLTTLGITRIVNPNSGNELKWEIIGGEVWDTAQMSPEELRALQEKARREEWKEGRETPKTRPKNKHRDEE